MPTEEGHAITTRWFTPCEWRTHLLADEPYWVEEEVLVLRGDVLVEQLSWSTPLSADARAAYDQAMIRLGELGLVRS